MGNFVSIFPMCYPILAPSHLEMFDYVSRKIPRFVLGTNTAPPALILCRRPCVEAKYGFSKKFQVLLNLSRRSRLEILYMSRRINDSQKSKLIFLNYSKECRCSNHPKRHSPKSVGGPAHISYSWPYSTEKEPQ